MLSDGGVLMRGLWGYLELAGIWLASLAFYILAFVLVAGTGLGIIYLAYRFIQKIL